MLTALFAQPPQPQELPFFLRPEFMLVMMVLFMVVIIMPMSRRTKREREAMLAAVRRGAKVVTSGGIVGIVVTAKEGEDEITVRSEDTKFRMLRAHVTQILGTDEAEAGK
jgi:preprotein translocase subunit YajC